MASLKILKINTSVHCFLILFILQCIPEIRGYPSSGTSDSEDNIAESWILATIFSVSSLLILVFVVFACGAGACCGLSKIHWFGRSRRDDVPTSFENPVAEGGTMMTALSQIDARALEFNPIIFEPLPTIHDLTPLSNQQHYINNPANIESGRDRMHPHEQKRFPIMIPFAVDDVDLYAHDWFDDQHRNFSRGNIEYIREIGKGWFGQVLEAEAKDIVPFARKINVLVKFLREDASQIEQMRFLDESRVYRDANHGNILKLLGHSIEKLPFLLIMEKCPQGNLKSYLISNVTRAEMLSNQGILIRMALDIAKGLEWMLSEGFKHHDLATRNCQVASEGRIVIGDYGLATQNFKDDYYWNSNVPIPLRWAAPETLRCTISTIQTLKVTKLANIWTFAIVLWEIMEFAKLPYFEMNDEEVITRVIAEKTYVLGQPTLPYIPLKEELYEIMRSCWNADPEKRPTMISIVSKLQLLYSNMTSNKTPPPADEFDSKWEQLGRSASSTNRIDDDDKPRKKSVSFTGIQRKLQDVEDIEALRKSDILSDKNSSNNDATLDLDDEHWHKGVERGDISQKVLEKSQSVQDLMVLTHVEPSELGDPDSLLFVSNYSQPTTNEPHTPNNSVVSCVTSNETVSQPQNHSSHIQPHETAFNRQANSGLNLSAISGCSLVVPEISVLPATPGTTPNKTGIDINIIQATPLPGAATSPITTSVQVQNKASTKIPNQQVSQVKKKLAFVFPDIDTTPKTKNVTNHLRRHTSTPKRSGSPLSSEVLNDNMVEDVFENTPPTSILNGTCNFSPISKTIINGVSPGDLVTSILVGASDDLGLNVFQGVTSQLQQYHRSSNSSNSQNSMEYDDIMPVTAESINFSNSRNIGRGDESESFGEDENGGDGFGSSSCDQISSLLTETNYGGEMSITPRLHHYSPPKMTPRILFAEETVDSVATTPKIGDVDVVEETTVENSSNSGWCIVDTKSLDTKLNESSWDVISDSKSSFETSNTENDTGILGIQTPALESTSEDTENMEEFWSKQIQSVQNAASNTRSLFQLSLNSFEGVDDKFVEDIEAANEELGSLVLHDLEDTSVRQTIVPETRDVTVGSPQKQAKLAFLGSGDDNPGEISSVSQISEVDSGTEITKWDVNNSIELRKSRCTQNINGGNKEREKELLGDEESDGEDKAGLCKDKMFMPSKWNQSLAPARPAIKSPAESHPSQSKSNLKKSVSFERKKTQLVYEYPPPPPATDSDEEERLHRTSCTLIAPIIPLSSSLDWELTQEELEDAVINHEDSEEEEIVKTDPMDMYRISGFGDEAFQVRGSNEPFVFQPSTLGELRHTRDRLKLDLSKGEASLLDEDPSKGAPAKLDSGVGSSTSASPFNNCDIESYTHNNNHKS